MLWSASKPHQNPEERCARLPILFTRRQWRMLGDWLHLTMRQVEVARLMCVGLGNSEPADALETTPDTVRIRRWVLFGKSNVDDRVGVPVQPVLTARKLSKRKGR